MPYKTLQFPRIVTLPAGFGNVSALVGTRNAQTVIDRLTFTDSLTSAQLADVSARLVAEYEAAELVAPIGAQSHVSEALGAVFEAQRDAMRKSYCKATLDYGDLPHTLDAKV